MKIKNRKARYNFDFIEKEIAGIVLTGTEIKSVRAGKVGFTDSFCFFKDKEMWVKNLHIDEYTSGTHNNHDPKRDRKLLLTKLQLQRFESKINEKGLTVVPVEIFINDKGLAKMEIALSKGKKQQDKRQIIKENDIKREMDREIKNYKS